jgi:bisphosphoglycerate-independent phosphoglycerate mutase (AlkP superfamily)
LVDVSETGTSTNTEKYVNVFYILDGGAETPFTTSSSNIGNFGSVTATQSFASGSSVQIIVR